MSTVEYRPWPRDSRYLVGSNGTVLGVRGRPLRPYVMDNGYLQVSSGGGARPWCARVHVIVCETFHGPRPDGHEVAHENNVRADCRAENLSWKTNVENAADKVRHGTVMNGERNPLAKLTEHDVREIRALAVAGVSQRTIAVRYGVTHPNVGYIVRRQTWRHVA